MWGASTEGQLEPPSRGHVGSTWRPPNPGKSSSPASHPGFAALLGLLASWGRRRAGCKPVFERVGERATPTGGAARGSLRGRPPLPLPLLTGPAGWPCWLAPHQAHYTPSMAHRSRLSQGPRMFRACGTPNRWRRLTHEWPQSRSTTFLDRPGAGRSYPLASPRPLPHPPQVCGEKWTVGGGVLAVTGQSAGLWTGTRSRRRPRLPSATRHAAGPFAESVCASPLPLQ